MRFELYWFNSSSYKNEYELQCYKYWIGSLMLIGVPFLPTTNWLHKLHHQMPKFVKPICGW